MSTLRDALEKQGTSTYCHLDRRGWKRALMALIKDKLACIYKTCSAPPLSAFNHTRERRLLPWHVSFRLEQKQQRRQV